VIWFCSLSFNKGAQDKSNYRICHFHDANCKIARTNVHDINGKSFDSHIILCSKGRRVFYSAHKTIPYLFIQSDFCSPRRFVCIRYPSSKRSKGGIFAC
jgi:hypothetical protein